MTGSSASRNRMLFDFDGYKNQEWLRRRKLRLEQVRKQSNEIAKTLRQKAIAEEKLKAFQNAKLNEAQLKFWKAEKLEELETKVKNAIEEFGIGHQLAEEEPEPEVVIEHKNKINFIKAQERGEIAKQQELFRKKVERERKMSPIHRKRLTRKLEDLRSALVRSAYIQKQLLDDSWEQIEGDEDSQYTEEMKVTLMKKKENSGEHQKHLVKRKMVLEKMKKKKPVFNQKDTHKPCKCKNKTNEWKKKGKGDTIWINLNELQSSSSFDTESKRSSKTSEKGVEVYDFPSRYYSKSCKEFPDLVEKIDPDSEPNANELAEKEEQSLEEEVQKKARNDMVSLERGLEALRKERINRDYNYLISKLEELNKKEKFLKTQQRIPPSEIYMSDERLLERARAKQKIMNAKFESIYFEAIATNSPPLLEQRASYNQSAGGDYVDSSDRIPTKLGFSTENRKTTTPASLSTVEPSSPEPAPRKKTVKSQKKKLLSVIDKTLKEGRKLRKAVFKNLESDSKSLESETEVGTEFPLPPSPFPTTETVENVSCQEKEAQTEPLKEDEACQTVSGNVEDNSLPLSSSTSYKSPPSVIRSDRLRQFLDYLEGLSETNETGLENHRIKRKIQGILSDLQHEQESVVEKIPRNPTLEYYIHRLLNMSRECVANLSVSSDNISTPNITDLDGDMESSSIKGEELIRECRLKRAEELEETIRNWKCILEENAHEQQSESIMDEPCYHHSETQYEEDNVPEQSLVVFTQQTCVNSPMQSKYDIITQKCSKRISELSNMLNQVRRDKERLLSSSRTSSLSATLKGDGDFIKPEARRTFFIDNMIDRYNSSREQNDRASNKAIADSQSFQEESIATSGSLPDVMDELLRKEIITSPFRWSEGSYTLEPDTKPSSIETAIGNFRREMSRIKPFCTKKSGDCCAPINSPSSTRKGSARKRLFTDKIEVESNCNSFSYLEESSVESINHALSSLGLNWAKSIIKKNEKSRGISSNSDRNSSLEEDDRYFEIIKYIF